jgi:hypothetical protein
MLRSSAGALRLGWIGIAADEKGIMVCEASPFANVRCTSEIVFPHGGLCLRSGSGRLARC